MMIIKIPFFKRLSAFDEALNKAVIKAQETTERFRLTFLYVEMFVNSKECNYIFKMDDLNDPWAQNKD